MTTAHSRRGVWRLRHVASTFAAALALSAALPADFESPAPIAHAQKRGDGPRPGDPPPVFRRPNATDLKEIDDLAEEADRIQKDDSRAAAVVVRRMINVYERTWGPDHPVTEGRFMVIGYIALHQGRYVEAADLTRHALGIVERTGRARSAGAAGLISTLGSVASREGRFDEAVVLHRRAIALWESLPDKTGLGGAYSYLGSALVDSGRNEEAEPVLARALQETVAAYPNERWPRADRLRSIGENLMLLGRTAEAERALAEAVRLAPKDNNQSVRLRALGLWADALKRLGRTTEADRAFLEAEAMVRGEKASDLPHAFAFDGRAQTLVRQGQIARALPLYEDGCLRAIGMKISASEASEVSACLTRAAALWLAFAKAGGDATRTPASLRAAAFEYAQEANDASAAGAALSLSGANAQAQSRAAGSDLRDYETAGRTRAFLSQLYAASLSDTSTAGIRRRAEWETALHKTDADIDAANARIIQRSPLYWSLRDPDAVKLRELQATSGPNARLLRSDEVLISFQIPPGSEQGLVFAVSKEGFASAPVLMSGDRIAALVRSLRQQIDPAGFGLAAGGETQPRAFDRQAAWQLYRALLGDPQIQAVMASKPSLIVVPSGPLTSLPLGVLVTAAPQGGPRGDADPDTLRRTPWLLRTKAITVLPAVTSLRRLRLSSTANRAPPRAAFLAFADPDFAGVRYGFPPARATNDREVRNAPGPLESYVTDGQGVAATLRTLPRLAGTRTESLALQQVLGASGDSLYLDEKASEANVRRLSESGALAEARVLAFATHGLLVGGRASRVAQPALALAAPAPGRSPVDDDGLLTAAEVAGLHVNADWVLLSACNTAAPDASEIQGLSGLMRGFFAAGARSIIVSQWRVRDDIAPRLIPDMIARAGRPGATKAQALRLASLAILDDVSRPDLAFPSAWATFMLVGEPGAGSPSSR